MERSGVKSMIPILLMGGGGHCKSVIDAIERTGVYEVAGIIDIQEKKGRTVINYPIVGTEDDLVSWFKNGVANCCITLGSVGNSMTRERLFRKAKEVGFSFPVIKDRSAIISDYAILEEGSFIGKGVILNADVKIGINAIVNTGAIIEHDCRVGAFSHISPGATLSGGVKVGNHTHVGTNSSVIQEVEIGNQTVIGAGSVVLKKIADNSIAYGNPCKVVSSTIS